MTEWINKFDNVLIVGGNLPGTDAVSDWEPKCIEIKDKYRNVYHKDIDTFQHEGYDLVVFEKMPSEKAISYAVGHCKDVAIPAAHEGFAKIPKTDFYHLKKVSKRG